MRRDGRPRRRERPPRHACFGETRRRADEAGAEKAEDVLGFWRGRDDDATAFAHAEMVEQVRSLVAGRVEGLFLVLLRPRRLFRPDGESHAFARCAL